MDAAVRIVSHLPLQELWGDKGFTTKLRGRWLADDDIASFLRAGPVQFVVINVGMPPRWIQVRDCYDFWKREVRSHLARAEERVHLDRFPGCYCYLASEWQSDAGHPIVVLEKHH